MPKAGALKLPRFNAAWMPNLGRVPGRYERTGPVLTKRLPRKLKKKLKREFGSKAALEFARKTYGPDYWPTRAAGYYDRQGRPMGLYEWTYYMGEGREERRVAWDDLPGGGFVSTVWLGLDHGFGAPGGPVIFESLNFPEQNHMRRYRTEAEALAGHMELVTMLVAARRGQN